MQLRRTILACGALNLCWLGSVVNQLHASTSRYTLHIDSSRSIVRTSGGIDGQGMGDLSIAGSFSASIDDNTIRFDDINVSTAPTNVPEHIVASYTGAVRQFSFQGRDPYDNETGGGDFTGMIDGSTFSMTGNYSAPCCDQFNYHYSLQGLASLIGDFNADGMLSAADIDMLTRVVVVGDSWFDLNGDGSLNEQDRLVLIENIMNTYIGDANLDGEHNTGDLVHVFKAGEYEDDIPGNSTWAEGDFNGDGDFSAFQSRGYELGPRWPGPAAPPNPQPRPDPTPGTPRWFGDLDLDERLTAGDIDLLSAAVPDGNNNRAGELFRQRGFDLNDDGSIDQTDRRFWLEEIKQSFCGDANLDGEFNSSGFLLLFQAGEYEDSIPANSTWAEGDWNGDFEANSSDFAFCLADGGYERGPRAALQSVPEPRSSALMMLVALGFFSRKLPRIRLH